jgi:hypothetical protein
MTTDLDVFLSELCGCEVSSTGRPDGSLVLAISRHNGGKFKRVIDRGLTLDEIVRMIRLDLFTEKGALSRLTTIDPHYTDALPTYSKKPLLRTRGSQLWGSKTHYKND